MSEKSIKKSWDWDDTLEPDSTEFVIDWIDRELGKKLPIEEFYAPKERLIEILGVSIWDEVLGILNMPFAMEEYLDRPLPEAYVTALRASAKKHEHGVTTSRPAFMAQPLLEKIERAGLSDVFKGGVHHVQPGGTKLDIMQSEGFDQHTDDNLGHIVAVASGGFAANAIVNTHSWNTDSALLESFAHKLPPHVRTVNHAGEVLQGLVSVNYATR